MKSLNLTKKYLLAEPAFAVFEIIFGLLSSSMAMNLLGLYSIVSAYCVASVEIFPKNKAANVGFLALGLISLVTAWLAAYSTYLTIGYADVAVKLWGLIPPIIVIFAKLCLKILYSEEEEVTQKAEIYEELVDYKFDLILVISAVLGIFLTFVFDFYVEYIVTAGIALCCVRKLLIASKMRKAAAKN